MFKQLTGAFFKLSIVATIFILFKDHQNSLKTIIFDAYHSVGIFVVITLSIVYFFEHYTQNSIKKFMMKYQKLQVPVAAFLGVLPGCGGAITVVAQYSKGYVTFGSMLATLIATMGDAAIILIQKKLNMALLLFVIVFFVAIFMGYLVDALSKEKFLPPNINIKDKTPTKKNVLSKGIEIVWFSLFILGTIVYFFPSFFTEYVKYFDLLSIMFCIGVWFFKSPTHACENKKCNACGDIFGRVAIEASFIVTWVFIGMACFEIIIMFAKIDVQSFVSLHKYYMPFMAMLVGLIPGCGPQIVFTTMYIAGLVPFSAQVSNTISNDGDALMPAIAMQPKKALLVTIYGIVPSLIVGYIILFMGY